jgi:hypothetical protein
LSLRRGCWCCCSARSRGGPPRPKHLHGKEEADARNATRQTLLAAVGGLVVLTGAVFAARTYYLSRRGQLTDRYTKAIGQLASSGNNLTERLGGIYALEHLMIESERDHDTVVEVLAAFIRERVPITPATTTPPGPNEGEHLALPTPGAAAKPPTDVQAALTVLGRRPTGRKEGNPIDLADADLRGARLQRARLDHLVAEGTQLQGAHLLQAQLQDAYLARAQLQGADLIEARLQGAYLFGAQLQGARLDDARLQGAFLLDAQLQDACLHGAQLQRAHLFDAQLQGANLVNAQLEDANLHGLSCRTLTWLGPSYAAQTCPRHSCRAPTWQPTSWATRTQPKD